MKKNFSLLTLCLAATLVLAAGCSKSKKVSWSASGSGDQAATNSSVSSTTNGPTDLTIKWQDGKKYALQMSLDQDMQMDVGKQPFAQHLKLAQGLHMTPLRAIDSGGHQIEMVFDSQKMDLTQNGQSLVTFDSSEHASVDPKSPAATTAKIMKSMLGVPLDYSIGADGKVSKIDGIDTLTTRLKAAVPNTRQRAMYSQLFDENTLKQYGAFSQMSPDHPVNIGDSWNKSDDIMTGAGGMAVDMTYTFEGWEQHDGHNCAHLQLTGTIKSKNQPAATGMGGQTVDVQSGKITGDVWFDPALGMFVDTQDNQDIVMKITARGQSISGHLQQTIGMSLLDVSQ
ncbi:MAG TPA: DUF6263 family protein [Verrucomicrobiae bacterium]|jgi:hypothetical protein